MKRLKSLLRLNPILVKEIRSRMRGPRAFITLTVTLVLMAGAMYGLVQLMVAISRYSYDVLSPRIGQTLFAVLAFLELVLVCAITPAVTAGAISGEREKRTYEMLQATPLSPSSILWGKLISALSYIFLLLFAAVPLASLVFVFGGVALRDMLKVLLVLVVLAVSFGMLGLFLSALFGRTGRATVASFVVVLAFLFIPLLGVFAVAVLRNGNGQELLAWRWMLVPSPISMLSSVLQPATGTGGISGLLPFIGGFWFMDSAIAPISMTSIPRPIYHYSLVFYLGLTLVLYLLTTRLLQPARRWRLRWQEILLAAGLLVGLGAVTAGGFLSTADRYEWVNPPATPSPLTTEVQMGPVQAFPVGTPVVVEVTVEPVKKFTATPILPDEMNAAFVGEVYAAVARQLYTQDHTLGDQTPNFPVLYLVTQLISDPGLEAGEGKLPEISSPVQAEMERRLSDLPTEIYWVPDALSVPREEGTGQVAKGGAIVSFGLIHPEGNGTLQVIGTILTSGEAGGGNVYILSQVDGAWQVTGTSGQGWVK